VPPATGGQSGVGPAFASTTFGWLAFAAEAEKTEEALNPATARTRTRVRIAMSFIIWCFSLAEIDIKFLNFSLDKPDIENIE
jgi:hypothetical protein